MVSDRLTDDLLEDLVGDFEVGVDRTTSSLSSSASISLNSLVALASSSSTRSWAAGAPRALDLDSGRLDRGAHRRQLAWRGDHLEYVVVGDDVLGPGLDRNQQVVLVVAPPSTSTTPRFSKR